jgi:hypothetical protein
MTFEKEAIRPVLAKPMDGKDEPVKPAAVESVRFTFKDGKTCTLNIADFTSGQAMVEAANAWAAKQ